MPNPQTDSGMLPDSISGTALGLSTARLISFFQCLAKDHTDAILLGGPSSPNTLNRWVIMGVGMRQRLTLAEKKLTVQGPESPPQVCSRPDAPTVFSALRSAQQQCRTWSSEDAQGRVLPPDLPFHGGLTGVFGYGFYPWCDSALFSLADSQAETGDADAFPEMALVECRDWLCWDLTRPADPPMILSDDASRVARYAALWAETPNPSLSWTGVETPAWRASLSQPAFEAAVETLLGHIRAGDIYQANLSIRYQARLALDPYAVFAELCRRNPSPFSGIFKCAQGLLVCNSPERLVRLSSDGLAETRPIAGTRGRGQTAAEDAAIGQTLLENEKERAEHLMLVDLSRNDLGRVCEIGSVSVDELLVLERYSHVTHLVSNVHGRLAPSQDAFGLLAAIFPGGTITGCPKIRCIELLNQVEPVARGWYTGSLGYIDAQSGAMDFNILIRSLYLQPELPAAADTSLVYNAAIHAGAGIVADAVPAHEYRECGRKAEALFRLLSPA